MIKIGGSILREEAAYARAAQALVQTIRRGSTWIVVSAARGVTDCLARLPCAPTAEELEAVCRLQSRLTGVPVSPALKADLVAAALRAPSGPRDELMGWGERASVEALRAHLAREGTWLPMLELGVGDAGVRPLSAVVPGFYVRDRQGRARCLPRNGSDISAVLLAAKLGAGLVRFWKEGGGIYSARGVHDVMSPEEVLSHLSGRSQPLHPTAVRLAARWGINLVLEDPFHFRPSTTVAPGPRQGSMPRRPDPPGPTAFSIPGRSRGWI